jgi:cell division septation protein DedD
MDQPLKQRLIGAAVLAALAVIFLPMLLKGPDVREPEAAEVPLSMPATPGQDFETRELPLTSPEPAPTGGVLGLNGAAPSPVAGAPTPVNGVPADAVAAGADPGVVAASPAPAGAAAPGHEPIIKPAPEPGTEGAGVGGGGYVVNIGSFGNRANAQSLASKLGAAGLPVLADPVRIATGDATRLRVGPYDDRAAAETARLRAESAANVSGSVFALDADASAMKPAPSPAASKAATSKIASNTPVTPTPGKPEAEKAAAATATKPGVAPKAAASPAVVSAGYAVQLSAPAAESDANTLRDRARAAGLSSFVQRIDTANGVRYRVRVGPYADRASADAALVAINARLGTHGLVMRHP